MNANSIHFECEEQIILVDKPAGISSFGVVAKVRGFLRSEFGHKVKIGHTGTLDPFATGLLILLSGKNTKRSNEFLKKDKTYEATLKLGFTSTTGDPEGEITKYEGSQLQALSGTFGARQRESERRPPVATGRPDAAPKGPAVVPSATDINLVLQKFCGNITQRVPAFSAVKINGERAYKLARKGQTFETPTRQVKIYRIELVNYTYPELTIRCHVSSGTYIRTLAEDIGARLGTGAYLTALRRLTIADYNVKDAHPLSDFTTDSANSTTGATSSTTKAAASTTKAAASTTKASQ